MLTLAFALMLAAAPAARPATPPAADPHAGHGHAGHDHGHDHGPKDEPPLDDKAKAVLALSEKMAAMTRENLAAYAEMLQTARDAREEKACAPAAKAIAARAKKSEAAFAKLRAESDAARKKMEPADQQSAAGRALLVISEELRGFRGRRSESEASIGAFKGRCPKQGAEVEKAFTALRKKIMP